VWGQRSDIHNLPPPSKRSSTKNVATLNSSRRKSIAMVFGLGDAGVVFWGPQGWVLGLLDVDLAGAGWECRAVVLVFGEWW